MGLTTYWTALDGSYLGGFTEDNPGLPIHAIQVPAPPPDGVGKAKQGNFRWDGEKWIIPTVGAVNDVQSGRYFVPEGEQYFVNEFFQSITKGFLDLEGDVIVDGQLFVED